MTDGLPSRIHQGSTLSSYLFAIMMGRLTDGVRQESPWPMMFIDDTVICCASKVSRREHGEVEAYTKEERNERSKQDRILLYERE